MSGSDEILLAFVWFLCGVLIEFFCYVAYYSVKNRNQVNNRNQNENNTINNRENTNTARLQNQFIQYVAEIELNSAQENTQESKIAYSYQVNDKVNVVIITDP